MISVENILKDNSGRDTVTLRVLCTENFLWAQSLEKIFSKSNLYSKFYVSSISTESFFVSAFSTEKFLWAQIFSTFVRFIFTENFLWAQSLQKIFCELNLNRKFSVSTISSGSFWQECFLQRYSTFVRVIYIENFLWEQSLQKDLCQPNLY